MDATYRRWSSSNACTSPFRYAWTNCTSVGSPALPVSGGAALSSSTSMGEVLRPDGPQIGGGDRQVADQDAETKEGVALGGAQPSLRDDEAPGPLTHVSAS